MISRTEKQDAADPITKNYNDLETLIMQNIIRHVHTYDQLIDSDDWLMTMLAQLGALNQENIRIISQAAGVSVDAVKDMCYEVADTVISRIEPGLTELERENIVKKAVPVEKSKNLKRAVETVHKQAKDSLNLCNTTMLYKAQEAYKNLIQSTVEKAKEIAEKQEYLDILGKHATAEVVGAESRQQAIRNTIKEFNELGIPAFVDKKGRNWTPEAYVSMTIRATAGNVSTEAMFARMEDRDLNLMAVSSHSGARPKCAKDQGKIFDRHNGSGEVEDLNGKKIKYYPLSSSSYGEPDGLFGINCGHHGTPFIPGVSQQRYFPTEDFEENAKLYKKMQTQRALERDVRKQKRLCMLYDEVGLRDSFDEASVILKNKEAKLASYIKDNKLLRRKDREMVVGFDKGVSARAVAANKRAQSPQFKGIPKNWKIMERRENNSLGKTNPKYNKIPLLYDKESRKYNENCANCVTAYEMRRRGYKVTAGAYINKLKREPEKAWKNPIVIEVNKEPRKEMEDFLKENGSKSRIQIKGTWNNLRRGHTFVAELRKEEIVFLDPQTGVIYNENILDTMNTISYWRIDNLEISDLGVTACEKE